MTVDRGWVTVTVATEDIRVGGAGDGDRLKRYVDGEGVMTDDVPVIEHRVPTIGQECHRLPGDIAHCRGSLASERW